MEIVQRPSTPSKDWVATSNNMGAFGTASSECASEAATNAHATATEVTHPHHYMQKFRVDISAPSYMPMLAADLRQMVYCWVSRQMKTLVEVHMALDPVIVWFPLRQTRIIYW